MWQVKICQNVEIFTLLLLNFLTSDLRKVVWCGHVEKSLFVSQPQRQRCCVHGYVASTGTWRNECNESTDGKNIRSLFLHHFLYKINLWKQNISHFDFTCFFHSIHIQNNDGMFSIWIFLSFLRPHSPWSELRGRSALKAFLGGKSPKPWNHDRRSPVENGEKKRLFLEITRLL